MSLGPGTRLGPYEIESAIGAGGMGEVYKARDTRLNRTVALKVLPEHVRDNPESKRRFEREARAIAALEHPHICVLHDVGHDGGIDFLVMEYLEGQTLAERLNKGVVPLDQALQYAIQIGDALDKAHRQGITHRDLKPGNVMLTKSGVKLLDFGLAKLAPVVPADIAGLTGAATQRAPLSGQGTILGTLQYMAPEQVEGKDADPRSDIFALGAVMYEMVTAKKAFEGNSAASVIASILSSEPSPISTLRPMTPPALDRLVKKCLSKDPEHRWQTARDLTSELQWIVDAGAQVHTGAARAARLRPSWALVLGVVLVVGVLASLAVWNLTRSAPAAARRPVRLSLPLPASEQLFGLALSPDGETLVYAGGSGANAAAGSGAARQLYRRTLDQLEPTPIPGTEGARYPFFSPDGTWIGFEVNGALKRLPLAGGLPVTIYDDPSASLRATNATGGEDDRIVFSPFSDGTPLQQILGPGGISQAVTKLAAGQGETHHMWPEILPGGRGLLYTVWPSLKIVVQSLETGERRDLVDGSQPRYVASGHIVFVRRSSLWAVPFDLDRLTVTGPAVQVVDTVRSGTDLSSNTFAVARNGTLLYSRGQPSVGQRLVWVTRDTREEALPGEPRADTVSFRLSPDGKRLAIVRNDEPGSTNFEIWVYDLIANTERQLTFDPAADLFPLWTPDGQRIVFSSSRAGGRNLFWRPADGTGRDERLTTSPNLQSPQAWSRDGTRLVFQERTPKTGWDFFVLSMNGDRSTSTLIQTEANELYPDVSPDGKWIAYHSNESGRNEVYVRPFPNVDDGKWRVSREGGNYAIWGPDGRELFYASLDGTRIMAVPVTTEPTFNSGAPKILLEGKYVNQGGAPSYDVSRDGQRFLMIKETSAADQAAARPELIVVLNWLDELKRLVPSN